MIPTMNSQLLKKHKTHNNYKHSNKAPRKVRYDLVKC